MKRRIRNKWFYGDFVVAAFDFLDLVIVDRKSGFDGHDAKPMEARGVSIQKVNPDRTLHIAGGLITQDHDGMSVGIVGNSANGIVQGDEVHAPSGSSVHKVLVDILVLHDLINAAYL